MNAELYPFGRNKVRIKFPETIKIGLNIQEIKIIENLIDLTRSEIHTRNVWLYSFNFAGMRIADVLRTRWCDIVDFSIEWEKILN